MNFVLSYSLGKDSIYALHTALAEGHTCVGLIVACNETSRRSFFHGADEAVRNAVSQALGLPMICTYASGDDYTIRFVEGLRRAEALGAEAVCYGDIYLNDARQWNEEAARAAGLIPMEPLWGRDPDMHTRELLRAGYKCLIKSVNTDLLPESLLGQYLTEETLNLLTFLGADPCGENGEYHTLVTDGPVFRYPLTVVTGKAGHSGSTAWIETDVQKNLNV